MNLRQAAQQALEALTLLQGDIEWTSNSPTLKFVNSTITALRAALAEPEQNPFGDDAERYARKLHEEREAYKALFTEQKPQTTHWEGCEAVHPECRKPEPVATKQMLRWVEHLKRLSDDGQHMSIPGLSSGACWELAIELEQFIKNTAPTPRKPLTDEGMRECAQAMNAEPLAEGWPELIKFARAIERAHGIGEQHE